MSLAAIYAPNSDNPEYFQGIGKLLRDRQENKIIIGDFNLTLNPEIDRKNTYCNNNKAKEEVENLQDEYLLKDIWRLSNEDKKEFSWIKKGQEMKLSRIDFALVSGGLDHNIEMIQYLSSIKTDHRALYMVLELNKWERGTGYWKFNNSFLSNYNFIQQMNKDIQLCLDSYRYREPCDLWETLKKEIKKSAVKFSRENASEQKLIIAHLSEKVNEYESSLPLSREENRIYEETKTDLEEAVFEKTKGIMFRSKVKWYEEGERNTKYFFALEKAKYNAKTCYKIIDEQGKETTEPEEILKVQRQYYANLYDIDKDVSFTLENNTNIKVPTNIREQQETQITMEDLQEAIKGMNNNKTPGQDGLPIDFYKVFWEQLKTPFFQMVQQVYREKTLHPTARKGILNLIPKANKDTRHVKNLRPITLLNTDYKIIEKSIANKMIPALEHIIHRDQRGFMKNRRISVNIRKMLDIMHEAEKQDLEAVVLSLDFVKCFDKCSFSILHGSLDFFEFGSIVKEWTKILYKDFTVEIQNNGHFSQKIDIKKGVHQGGCCSSVYFLVIAEILALALRQNEQIEGITIRDIRNLLNQFADDMDIFSLATKQSIEAIFYELERFRKQSGFTVSYEKTTMYRIGSLRHSNAQLYNMDQFTWSKEDITVLGIKIAHQDILQKNYEGITNKVKETLNAWHNRGLSLMGKVQVVNTLVASLFVYKMMVMPIIPKNIVKNIDNLIRQFLWNGKKAKIAYKILQNPKSAGGLKLVNLENKDKALKSTWPQILHSEEDYANIVYGIIGCHKMNNDIWRCSLKQEDVRDLQIANQFWEDVVSSWCQYNYYHERRIENQFIWRNSLIKINQHTLFWEKPYTKGLKYVHQLFDNRTFKTFQQMKNQYHLTMMNYNSLKSAIPQEWKDYFQEYDKSCYMPIPPHNYDMAINVFTNNFSSRVYNNMADDALLIHNKIIKWKQELGIEYDQTLIEFGKEHLNVYRTTNVTKYRSFQYRLMQRGIVTNIQLHKWGMAENELCSFCKNSQESLVHLFVECDHVQAIWKQFCTLTEEKYRIKITEITSTRIIFNRLEAKNSKNHRLANFLCLIIKQYIYRQRCQKKQLRFIEIEGIIRHMEAMEKYIATKNYKIETHNRKWMINQPARLHDVNEFTQEYIDMM